MVPQRWVTINETDKGEEFQAAPVISKVRKFAEARVCVSSVEQRRRMLTMSGKELHPDVSAACASIAICSLVPYRERETEAERQISLTADSKTCIPTLSNTIKGNYSIA